MKRVLSFISLIVLLMPIMVSADIGGSSPELCVKVRGSSSMLLRLGCLGDLLGLEE